MVYNLEVFTATRYAQRLWISREANHWRVDIQDLTRRADAPECANINLNTLDEAMEKAEKMLGPLWSKTVNGHRIKCDWRPINNDQDFALYQLLVAARRVA